MAQYVYSMQAVTKVVPPKRKILENVSLSFFPGAKIGVLGLNGAGKSTLIHILTSLVIKSSGQVRVGGVDLDQEVYRVRQQLGLVPQEFNFNLCGIHALDSCRIEKAYRHFGHDITDEDHVVDAGLCFTADLSKTYFKGKEATTLGLAGVGDLYVSAAGGRNSKMGSYLGKGFTFRNAKKKIIPKKKI